MHISTDFGVPVRLCARNAGFAVVLKIGSPQALAKSGCAFPPCKGVTNFQRAAGGFSGNSVVQRGVRIVKVCVFHGSNGARTSAFQCRFLGASLPPGILRDSFGFHRFP